MIDELLKSAEQLRSDAQEKRRKARRETVQAKRDLLFNDAAVEFQKAITALERGLRTVRRKQDGYTPDVCRVLEALSQSYGSLGGTWRDAGDRQRAGACTTKVTTMRKNDAATAPPKIRTTCCSV